MLLGVVALVVAILVPIFIFFIKSRTATISPRRRDALAPGGTEPTGEEKEAKPEEPTRRASVVGKTDEPVRRVSVVKPPAPEPTRRASSVVKPNEPVGVLVILVCSPKKGIAKFIFHCAGFFFFSW
jgi:hypothetical protein